MINCALVLFIKAQSLINQYRLAQGKGSDMLLGASNGGDFHETLLYQRYDQNMLIKIAVVVP